MGSRYINDFTIYGRNFRVWAQADTFLPDDIDKLGQYYVPKPIGGYGTFKHNCFIQGNRSAPLITHFNYTGLPSLMVKQNRVFIAADKP